MGAKSMARARDQKTKDLFAYAEDNRPSIVYMATNTVNGKRYIGMTRMGLEHRIEKHFCHARNGRPQYFVRAIRKHGEDAFRFEVIAHCASYKEAWKEERRLILELLPEYNMTLGGEGILGHRHNAETRKKMSEAKKGKSPWPKGQYPAEVRAKIVAHLRSRRGTFQYTDAHKEKMRENGKKANEGRRKPVVCLTDGLAFRSTTEAAAHYGCTNSMIIYYCRGTAKNKRASTMKSGRTGLEFAYAHEAYEI